MSAAQALALFLVMLPLAAMPSASVALVVARSGSGGRASGAFCALGIVAGDLLFVAIALFGMSLLAQWMGALFGVLRFCGAAYLIWQGIRLLRPRKGTAPRAPASGTASPAGDFLAGLALTLGDAKAILFYASLFPALVDIEHIGPGDAALIAAITAVTVGGVKLAYALLAERIVRRLRAGAETGPLGGLAGVVMIGCGSALALKA